jgi:hypothetical protein
LFVQEDEEALKRSFEESKNVQRRNNFWSQG